MKNREKYKDLEEKIENYFITCDAVNCGKAKIKKPYTLSGMLCHIGLTREEFEALLGIKRHRGILLGAKARIEAFIEENALTGSLSSNASANSLKYNFGWGEKSEKTHEDEKCPVTVTLSPEMTEFAR